MVFKTFTALFLIAIAGLFFFKPPVQAEPEAIEKIEGVGALGRVEPRSRVIRVSHNAGPEGAKVEELFVQEGSIVNKDEPLAKLADYAENEAKIDAVKAKKAALEAKLKAEQITLAFNRKEYFRFQSLQNTSSVSISNVDAKRLAFQQSEATVKQLAAEISSASADQRVADEKWADSVILAPISGTVVKINTRQGERIGDADLLELADLTLLDAVAEVYEADLPDVHVGQQASVQLLGMPHPYSAQVREIGFQVKKNDMNDTDPLADRDNRIVEVRLTLEDQAVTDLQHQIYRQVQIRILP